MLDENAELIKDTEEELISSELDVLPPFDLKMDFFELQEQLEKSPVLKELFEVVTSAQEYAEELERKRKANKGEIPEEALVEFETKMNEMTERVKAITAMMEIEEEENE